MEIKEKIKQINKDELLSIYNDLKSKNIKEIQLDRNNKYIFTLKKFEVFLRLYVDENIQVYIRTNTINSRERINYTFVDIDTITEENLDKYRNNIIAFYKNIIKEAINTFFCVEHHNEMTPTNATSEEIKKSWCTVYEQRLLTILNYNNMDDFEKWLEKVTNTQYIEEQKSLG